MTRKKFIGGVSAVMAGTFVPTFAGDSDQMAVVCVKADDFFLRRDVSAMRKRLLSLKFNTVLVDVQDSLIYPSHPEIAVDRSLPADKASNIVKAWRKAGFSVVPLLDFCTARDSWLGVYDRMVCSKPYDALVRDLLKDAYAIFGSPRFIHIGFSDEGRSQHPSGAYAVMRQGDLWMRYLIKTSNWVKETGSRTWAWFDYPWGMKDFLLDSPRDIVYSNFKPLDKRMAGRFAQVVKAGCDVVPFVRSNEDAAVVDKLPSSRILGILKEVKI
jgi:hypothetical protein